MESGQGLGPGLGREKGQEQEDEQELGTGRVRVSTITGLLDSPIYTEPPHGGEGVTFGVKMAHYVIRFFPDVMAVIWICVMTKLVTDVGTQDWLWFVGKSVQD